MTAPLTVYAPMWVEEARLRRELAPNQVRRLGIGPRAARRSEPPTDRPLAVAGIGGGLRSDLAPGDVVVATEVRGPDGVRIELPSAPILAAALRRRSQRVRLGPIVSVPRLALGDERVRLAGTGALVADTESAWFLEAAAGGRAVGDGDGGIDGGAGVPLACVRVVADAPPVPLVHPRTAVNLGRALDGLPVVGAALREWAAAYRRRTVLLAAPRSFCAGVERAIEVVERALEIHQPPVYVRKQIVHNRAVVDRLSASGAVFVEELDEVPPGATVVFSAHGVAPAVRTAATGRRLEVIDATCPLVAKVHQEARRAADRGGTVVMIGHLGHEEVEGTVGEAPERTVVVQDRAEAERLELPETGDLSYVVQTTLAHDDVAEVVEVLRRRFPHISGPRNDDICYATTNRQHALREIAGSSDVVLVIGSANSSNGNRLVEVARRSGTPAHLVDGPDEVDPRWLTPANTVGVSAAASTPPELVDAVVDAVRGLGPTNVEERRTSTEDIQFALPKEVRSS